MSTTRSILRHTGKFHCEKVQIENCIFCFQELSLSESDGNSQRRKFEYSMRMHEKICVLRVIMYRGNIVHTLIYLEVGREWFPRKSAKGTIEMTTEIYLRSTEVYHFITKVALAYSN